MDLKNLPKIEITFAPVWWQQKYGMDFSSPQAWQDPLLSIQRDREQRRLLFERFGDAGLGEADPQPDPVVGGEFGHRFMSAFWGCEVTYLKDQWPHAAALQKARLRMQNLTLPDLDTSPAVKLILHNAQTLEDRYGSCRASINYGGPLNNAVSVLGEEIFVQCAEDPVLAQEVLFRMAQAILVVCDQVESQINQVDSRHSRCRPFEIGNCPVGQVSPSMYRKVILPVDRWLAEQFEGEFWLHHCGFFHPYAQVYQPLLPQALDVGPGTNLRLTRQAYPAARISAYIDPGSLMTINRDQLDALVTNMVMDIGSTGNFTWIRVAEIGPEISDDTVRNLLSVFDRIKANL